MNKIFSLALVAVFTLSAVPALAAMPNYVGTDYKQGPNCTQNDSGIFEDVSGITTKTGCITSDAWARAKALSASLQSTGVRVASGARVLLVASGLIDTCPAYIRAGCVAPTGSVLK